MIIMLVYVSFQSCLLKGEKHFWSSHVYLYASPFSPNFNDPEPMEQIFMKPDFEVIPLSITSHNMY